MLTAGAIHSPSMDSDTQTAEQTLAERTALANQSAQSRARVLKGIFGIPAISLDGASTGGDLRAIRAVLIRAGLTTEEEFAALCAEGMDQFLASVMSHATTGVLTGETSDA